MDWIREGGLGVIPVLVLGAVCLATSVTLVARPSRGVLVLALGSAFAVLVSGGLGTVVGLRNAASAATLERDAGGCLVPLLVALYALGAATPIAVVGAYRVLAGAPPR